MKGVFSYFPTSILYLDTPLPYEHGVKPYLRRGWEFRKANKVLLGYI